MEPKKCSECRKPTPNHGLDCSLGRVTVQVLTYGCMVCGVPGGRTAPFVCGSCAAPTTVQCTTCGKSTSNVRTQLCNPCWEANRHNDATQVCNVCKVTRIPVGPDGWCHACKAKHATSVNSNGQQCKDCGETWTSAPSGRCLICEGRRSPRAPCRFCRKVCISKPSGCCDRCWRLDMEVRSEPELVLLMLKGVTTEMKPPAPAAYPTWYIFTAFWGGVAMGAALMALAAGLIQLVRP